VVLDRKEEEVDVERLIVSIVRLGGVDMFHGLKLTRSVFEC